MPSSVQKVWDWLQTPEGKKLFRYTMTSVISTIVANIALFLAYGVFRLWTEVPATIFGNAVATFPSYWLNRNWAWGKKGRSHFMKEVVPFWTMSVLGIAFSTIGASLARHESIEHHFSHHIQTGLVIVANIISFSVFWVIKLLIFNRVFHVAPLHEIEEHLEHEIHPDHVAH